jgi:hypothetical protein
VKTAICYLSCDKPEMVNQSLPPLVDSARKQQYHLFCIDGSRTQAGEDIILDIGYPTADIHSPRRW